MRRILLISALMFFWQTLTTASDSQATRLLDKIVAQLQSGKGIATTFTLQQEESEKVSGILDMQGEKFLLRTPEMTTWFDGSTQWSYLSSSQEVNITVPEKEELLQTTPYLLLKEYKTAFFCQFIKKESSTLHLQLTPKTESEIARIELFIDERTETIARIVVYQTDNRKVDITLTQYEAGRKFPENHFIFEKDKFPQAEIIDLR